MITVSKKVEYSLVFIAYLSRSKDKLVSLTEASKILNLPYRFLGRLALDLKQSGMVESKEGKTGGYLLKSGWRDKSLYDLMVALGENRHVVGCLGDKTCSRIKACEMRNIWSKLETTLIKELKKIKLGEAENF